MLTLSKLQRQLNHLTSHMALAIFSPHSHSDNFRLFSQAHFYEHTVCPQSAISTRPAPSTSSSPISYHDHIFYFMIVFTLIYINIHMYKGDGSFSRIYEEYCTQNTCQYIDGSKHESLFKFASDESEPLHDIDSLNWSSGISSEIRPIPHSKWI